MAIIVNDTTPRDQYTATNGQTAFTYSFEIFEVTDIKVYNGSSLLTYASSPANGTQYSVSNAGVTGGGVVTLGSGGASTGNIITIIRDIPVKRTTDFPSSGPFNIDSLNTDLDKIIAIVREREDEMARSIKLSDEDPAATLTLPLKASRQGKVLSFSSTGNVETTVASTDVTTIANIASDVTAVSGIASNVTSVASNASNINTVAGKASEITSVAAKASLITSDFVSDLNAVAVSDVISDLNTLATSDIVTDINALATSDIISDLNTIAVSDVISDLNTIAVSDVISDINTLGTSDIVSDLNQLATSDFVSDLNALEAIKANITTVAGVSSNVTSVAGNATNITAVNSNSANINAVNSNSSNINAVNSNASNINAVNSNASNINAVAGNASNINTVAGANSNIGTVASNIAGVNSFADRYRVGSSDPSSDLDEGDLAYNTNSNAFKYYNGSAWEAIVAGSLTDIVQDGSPQLGANLDVQTHSIVSTSNRNIAITPNGSGKVVLDGLSMPTADGNAGEALVTNGGGVMSFTAMASGGGNFLGNDGEVGSNANNIIRVHSATLNYSGTLTLASSENGLVAGPLTVAGSTVLDVQGTLVVL
tara:strand:+ start:32 stop:1825 length:1794 start_codon:yes stop_codon:yes gene_type:complete